jgi:hypothetical protein
MRRVAMVATLLVGFGGGCKGDEDRERAAQARRVAEQARVRAEQARAAAEQAAAQAEVAARQLREAGERVHRLKLSMNDARAAQNRLTDLVMSATTDVERAAAAAKLDVARQRVSELETKLAEAEAAVERAERLQGIHVTKECLENPLAKGCS